MRRTPPRLPLRLLKVVLPAGSRGESIVGDLVEEWHRRDGPLRGPWFWAVSLSLTARYLVAGLPSALDTARADARAALRGLVDAPVQAALLVTALALGISAPATMFSIVRGLTRPPDVPNPERVIHVGRGREPGSSHSVSLERLRPLLRPGVPGLARVSLYGWGSADLREGEGPREGRAAERVAVGVVTPGFFRMLRVEPVLGRAFTEEDARSGEPPVLLGWRLWRERFGGDPDILGRTVRLDGDPWTVVGVMPEEMRYPVGAEVWRPLDPTDPALAGVEAYQALARLAPGASLASVRDQLAGLDWTRIDGGVEASPDEELVALRWEDRLINPRARRALDLMVFLVTSVLLIACANVANMLLARALARRGETAVRVALGASRGRIVRRHLTEAGVLALLGGAAGIALTAGTVALFRRTTVGLLAPWMDIGVDVPVLLFCGGLVTVTTLATGALPSLQAGRMDVAGTLRGGDEGGSSFRLGRLNRGMVVGEIALSCALLVGAGLMVRNAVEETRSEGDFPTRSVLTASLELRAGSYPSLPEIRAFHRELVERVGRDPAIAAAGAVSHLPGVTTPRRPVEVEGRAYERPQDRPLVHVATVSPGFLDVLEADVVLGRPLRWEDGAGDPPAVLVNEAFARRHLAGSDPLGARIRLSTAGREGEGSGPWATVVGVVPALGVAAGADSDGAGVYVPISARGTRVMQLVLRARDGVDPYALLPGLRGELRAMDPDVALFAVASLSEQISSTRVAAGIIAVLFAGFGVVGLLLAAVGLYGLLSFAVRRRVRELGVRTALGAAPPRILWTVLRGGAAQTGAGLAIGLTVAALATPSLVSLLPLVDGRDPWVFGTVAGVLGLTGFAAAVVPARRALRLDVVEALKTE